MAYLSSLNGRYSCQIVSGPHRKGKILARSMAVPRYATGFHIRREKTLLKPLEAGLGLSGDILFVQWPVMLLLMLRTSPSF